MIYDRRSVDLRWLFDPVLSSSLDNFDPHWKKKRNLNIPPIDVEEDNIVTKPRGGLCITLAFVMTYEELWIFASMKTFSHWSLLSFPSDSLLTWIKSNQCGDCCSLGMKSDLPNVTSSIMIVIYWNAHRSKKLSFYLCTSLLPLFLFVHQEPTHRINRINWNMIKSLLKNRSSIHRLTIDWHIHLLCFFLAQEHIHLVVH